MDTGRHASRAFYARRAVYGWRLAGYWADKEIAIVYIMQENNQDAINTLLGQEAVRNEHYCLIAFKNESSSDSIPIPYLNVRKHAEVLEVLYLYVLLFY
jgi:hypothetical protein